MPLRWDGSRSVDSPEVRSMAAYLEALSDVCLVTVVDGSTLRARRVHEQAWGGSVRVIGPHGKGANGKTVGAVTGIREAREPVVVIADDDVRHDRSTLEGLLSALEDADVVRPQNVYRSWPWQARWDFGRSLVARAFGADWPGTFALRVGPVAATGGWDADVMFENLQMVRTAEAYGLRVRSVPHLVVGREPPSVGQFWSQRVRQAYDDFAQPGRLVVELALLPVAIWGAGRPRRLAAGAAALVVLGEVGRRRFGGVPAPATSAVWCPVWALERSVCVWVALVARLRGGVVYRGRRVLRAAAPVHAPLARETS